MTEAEIEKMFPWGKKEIVPTKKGLRYRRQIRKPNRQSVALYSLHKSSLTGEGVVYSEYPLGSGTFSLTWWQHVSKEEEDRRRKAQALSEATDGQIVVPAPAELTYRPFQRTFVQFVLNGLGVDVNRMIPGQAPDERAFQGLFGMPMLPAEQRRTGFLLGDEMGLGKSIQAIALINGINGIAGRKTLGKILYICPAGLKNNTVRELRKWLTNTYTIGIADGGMFPSSEIVVINYQVLHKWERELTTDWDIIFIDEAQNLRNDTARMTQHALGYKGSKETPARPQIPAKLRIAMSGTPAVNRVSEMWTILNWLDPISFGDKWRFEQKYCAASKASGWYSNKGSSNEAQLQALLKSTIMIRRLKRDVAKELPPKQRQLMILPNEGGAVFDIMSHQLANWVQKMASARAAVEWAKTTDEPGEYERATQKLQDAIDSGSSVTSPLRIESAKKKLPMVIPILEEAAETAGKIIVCAYHRFVVEELTRAFHGKCMTVYGGIPAAQRQQLVDRFQNDPTCKYAVLSIPTAVGMTLTAASMVYFVEEDWIPGNITQAEDRAHRIGQTDSVNVIHLVLDKSIDMVMADQVMRKQKKLDLVFDVNEEKGRDEMEPVIPIPGFTASFKELARESLRIGREVEAARAMAQANLDPDDSNLSDQLILDRFLRTKDPWPKLVALVSMMCASRSVPAPQPKPKSAPIPSTPVRSLGLPGNRDSQAELTLA